MFHNLSNFQIQTSSFIGEKLQKFKNELLKLFKEIQVFQFSKYPVFA